MSAQFSRVARPFAAGGAFSAGSAVKVLWSRRPQNSSCVNPPDRRTLSRLTACPLLRTARPSNPENGTIRHTHPHFAWPIRFAAASDAMPKHAPWSNPAMKQATSPSPNATRRDEFTCLWTNPLAAVSDLPTVSSRAKPTRREECALPFIAGRTERDRSDMRRLISWLPVVPVGWGLRYDGA